MNFLITGAWNCTQEQLEHIAGLGHRFFFLQNEKDPLPLAYEDVEGVICNGLFLHHPVEKFANLRYIQLTSAGFDRVPMDYIKEKGIAIYNAREVYSIPMAEFAIGGVLQLYKQSRFFAQNQAKGIWQKHRGLMELYGKTVCIIGCGSVGTECAKRFAAFGSNVIGVAPHPREDCHYSKMVPLEELEQMLAAADITVLSLPLTEASRKLINRQRLAAMKAGAILVNIARGAVVDTEALVEWLKAKQGAAVLDVFDDEPLPADSALWQMENVILTPHNSFVGDGNRERLYRVILENLASI